MLRGLAQYQREESQIDSQTDKSWTISFRFCVWAQWLTKIGEIIMQYSSNQSHTPKKDSDTVLDNQFPGSLNS